MPNYKKFVEEVGPPLEPGEVLIDARLCIPRGSTLRRGLLVGGAIHSGALQMAVKGAIQGIYEAAKEARRNQDAPHAPSEADRLPAGNTVLAVTNSRYRLYRHTEGWYRGKLSYLRDERLDWISDGRVEFRFSAPALTVTFCDGSKANLELPRQWGADARGFAEMIQKAKADSRAPDGATSAPGAQRANCLSTLPDITKKPL